MKFISVKDVSGDRNVSLAVYDNQIKLLGVLPHQTVLSMEPKEAKKLVTILNKIIKKGKKV